MIRRYRKFLRRRGGFIPGTGPRRPKTAARKTGSRTSDFYAKPMRRPGLSLPAIYRGSRTAKATGTQTQTKTQRALRPAPQVQTKTKRAVTDKKVRVIDIMRRRYKRPTMNRRKPSTAMEYVNTPGEGNSTSYFIRKALRIRGFKKKVMKASPLQLRNTEIVNNMSWVYGRQTYLIFLHNTAAELNTLAGTIPGLTNTTQMLLQSTKLHYMITSGSKAGIKLRIYEGCYKKDLVTAYDPGTLWTNGLLDTGTTMSPLDIDSKPFGAIGFNKQCHIAKVTNVFLPQGRTHEHYVTYNYNKLFNREETNLSSNAYLKGWTRFTMFVAYGEPIADTDLDVSTASGRLLILGTKSHRYRYNTPVNYSGSYVRSIPTTGITSERLLDEGSGEIEVNVSL